MLVCPNVCVMEVVRGLAILRIAIGRFTCRKWCMSIWLALCRRCNDLFVVCMFTLSMLNRWFILRCVMLIMTCMFVLFVCTSSLRVRLLVVTVRSVLC